MCGFLLCCGAVSLNQLLKQIETQRAVIAVTPHLLHEVSIVLRRSSFATRLSELNIISEDMVAAIVEHTELFPDITPPVPAIVREDPDDDHVILCAQISNAQAIITGDSHILNLALFLH